jgi:hypothetical protein
VIGRTRRGAGILLAPLFFSFLLAGCSKPEIVTLALLGDLSLGRGVIADGSSLEYLVPELAAVDIAIANLESPLAEKKPAVLGEYNLCAEAADDALLSGWGLDMLSLANNHRNDCSPSGPEETGYLLEEAGLIPLGLNLVPIVRQVNGLKLAFLAVDDVSSPLDEVEVVRSIRDSKASGALVVVSIHWGNEYQAGASPRQVALAAEFAKAGASLVWGHHPHVLQPAAWLTVDDSASPQGQPTLVLYSLGNALFDQGAMQDTRLSALAVVTLDSSGVRSVRWVPFKIDPNISRLVAPDQSESDWIVERLHLCAKP